MKRYEDSGSAIYSPTLPPPEYLDEEQKKLGESIGDNYLNDHFLFVDQDIAISKGIECPLKPWSQGEKADIRRIFDCVLHRAPGVLLRATAGGPIKLARVSTFKGSKAFGEGNSPLEEMAPLAAAHESSISLSDRFFRCDQQAHGLVHEMVHIADVGGRTAFSKEWAGFALPEISAIRKKTELMSYKQMAAYQKDLRLSGQWPSLYATVNLREALAEYVGEYAVGTDFKVRPDFAAKIGTPFLRPSKDELKWLADVQLAMEEMGRKDYNKAIGKFEESIQQTPWTPMPYLYIAHCLMHGGKDFTRADQMIGKAIACFDAAGIPALEPDTKLLVPLRAGVLAERGDYSTAIKLLDQVLLESPGHREALMLRSWCQFYRGFLARSAQDYYLAKCSSDDMDWALFNAPVSRIQAKAGTISGAHSIEEERRSITAAIKKIESLEKVSKKLLAMSEYTATIKRIEALELRLAHSRIAK